MPTPILATKLYIPRLRPNVVIRPRLIERLNEGLYRKLTLISAPAGFGKTTLVSQWVEGIERPAAWLSLDEGENDPARFLTYLVSALQTIAATLGEGVLGVVQSPQPPPAEALLTALPFTHTEAAGFLNQVMGLNLSAQDIAALETRTEGWIAGLQLAAISMQGQQDAAGFITSFTGSHHFVLDYLLEEVLGQQPERIQNFLLRTSILDRMTGPLCDAVLLDPSASGQETLDYLERANLFIVPLDNERHCYRSHHLFADLLRQRLHQ